MSRQLDQVVEQRQAAREKQIVQAVEYALVEAVGRAGAELLGFSATMREEDVLVVLRVSLAGRKQVAFVGSSDLGSALIKAVREARGDKLKWRDDRYGGQS